MCDKEPKSVCNKLYDRKYPALFIKTVMSAQL
jgi:hypothetical protein